MDDNMKAMIDDYTEIDYRYGKVMGQIYAVIAACEYELHIRGREKWTSNMEDVNISAVLILHMLGQNVPADIAELYRDKAEPISHFDPEDDE